MNAKTNQLTIIFICFFGFLLVGCGNSSQKQQATQETQQEYPLKKIFNRIYTEAVDDYKKAVKDEAKPLERYALDTDTIYRVFQDSVVKDKIISLKTLSYYNMILGRFFYDMNTTCAYISNNGGYNYSILLYTCYGDVRMDKPSTILTYNPNTDKLDIETTIDGRVVQSNGEVYYNTEGWEIQYPKDEFDEDITSQPVLHYSLIENDGLITYNPIWINIVPVRVEQGIAIGCILCTNKLGYSSSNIVKILIKDNKSDKIYNIAFDKPYYEEYSGFKYADVGVGMFNNTFIQFMNIITGLADYTISFINEEGENAVIKNPKNLCNIRDAFEKFMEDYKKME